MRKSRKFQHNRDHDIYFHEEQPPENLKPRDIVQVQACFKNYDKGLIEFIKKSSRPNFFENRTKAQLDKDEMKELEKYDKFEEIKEGLKSFAGIDEQTGFRVNIYHQGLGFKDHHDGSFSDHYFPFEDKEDFYTKGSETEEPEETAITAAVCFGSSRTLKLKYDRERATISRPKYKDQAKPRYSICLDLEGGDYYAFSRGFEFDENGLKIKGINSTHTHCVLPNPRYGKEMDECDIHVSFVIFGCTAEKERQE